MKRTERNSILNLCIKHKTKLIKWTIILIALLAIFITIFHKAYSLAENKFQNKISKLEEELDAAKKNPYVWDDHSGDEITIELIESTINEIGELASIEYLYTDAGKFENPKKLFGINVPLTTKSFIAKWDGIIKAGVKIDEIYVKTDNNTKEITIYMPNAEILSHEIDENSIETLDEKDGLFNSIKVDDIREFDAVNKEKMEERAIENGILDKAFENAKEIIQKLITTSIIQNQEYTIKFEVIKN